MCNSYVKKMNSDQVQERIEELLWFKHVTRLWTKADNNKKKTSRGLKKIWDDAQ